MKSYIQEFQNQKEKNSELIITVDGPSGSGKGTLGEQIADLLNIKHFSASDIFYEVAEKRNIDIHQLSKDAEKKVDLEVDKTTLERGLNNNCVIEGRIPGWVLGEYADLRIYLTAQPEERYKRIAARENMKLEEAEKRTEKRDEDNHTRYQNYYQIDTKNLEIYDLIIDNTDLEPREQIELVEKALKQQKIIKTE